MALGPLNTRSGAGLENRLRQRREARSMTQQALADAVGVSRKTINTVERGVFVPSTILALKLAEVLDARVEEIFALAPSDDTASTAPETGGARGKR